MPVLSSTLARAVLLAPRQAVAAPPSTPTPPGGVTTNLLAWFEGDQISSVADGGAVASWPDMSGNSRDATQAIGTAQPTYRATGGPNGKPTVEFDGGDELATPAFTPGTAAMTWYIVASTAVTGDQMLAEFSTNVNTPTTGASMIRESVGSISGIIKGDVGYATCGQSSLSTTPKLVSVIFDKSLATNEVSTWLNGVAGTNRANNNNNTNTFSAAHSLYLGRRNAGSVAPLVGKLTLFLAYAGAHDTTTRQAIETAINTKYALGF